MDNHSPYDHIIWDWNGTLLDDAPLCVAVMNGSLARRSLPLLTPETYEVVFDFPVKDYYRKIGFDFAREPFEVLSDEFMAGYRAGMGEAPLRAGVREAFELVKQANLTQSILSAMEQTMLEMLLRRHNLDGYLTDVVGLTDHHAFGKVETGRQWIASQTLDPARILFVGDTVHDVEVAQALGVDCITIYSGHAARSRLEAACTRMLDSLTGIADYL